MPTGRKTGGRKKGVPNKVTLKREAEVRASGLAPLDHMLAVMRDETAEPARRDEMAKAAAPYVHPKLASVEHTGAGKGPIQVEDRSPRDLARRIALALASDASD